MGCRNKLTIAGLAFLLTMLESVQVKAPRTATGGSGTQTLLVAAQVDALDVSGNSLLDDSIPYFAEVRGVGWRAQAGPHACVRACAQVCLRARTHVRTFDPARPGRTRGSAHASLRLAISSALAGAEQTQRQDEGARARGEQPCWKRRAAGPPPPNGRALSRHARAQASRARPRRSAAWSVAIY